MHIGHLNVNSSLSKTEELRTLAFKTDISALGITETKLDNTVSNEELKIDGYNLLRSDRNKNGGRVACYIKNNIAHNHQSSISENIENIVLDILLPKSKPISVDIIYRPLNQVYFFDHFNNALGKLPFQSNKIYLLGDFNINLFFEGHYALKKYFERLKEAHLKHRPLKPYVETFLVFRLNQLIEKPARSTLRTVSVIDHILTNSKEKVSNYGVISIGISDHDFIYCTRKTKTVKTWKHNTISVRSYRKYSKESHVGRFRKKDLPDYSTIPNEIAPVKGIRVKGNSKPWFDSDIMEAIRVRDKLKGRFLRTKLYVDHERFKEQFKLVQQKIKNKKTNFVRNYLQKNT